MFIIPLPTTVKVGSIATVSAVAICASAHTAPPQRTMTNTGFLRGTCSTLVMSGNDYPCDGKVANTNWSDGRGSFTFFIPGPKGVAALTFSGMASAQTKPNEDTAVQPVDTILFNLGAGMPPARPDHAVGSCRFTNPYLGRATIDCVAETSSGSLHASFVTDGQPPQFIRR